MTTPLCSVLSCDRPCPDQAAVCTRCAGRLRADLEQVPTIAAALDDARARRVRMSDPGGGGASAEKPLPLDLKAGELHAELVRTLRQHADPIARTRGLARPLDTPAALAGWLASQVQWLRFRPDGPAVVVDVARVLIASRRHVDRPVPAWYAGPCGGLYVDDNGLLAECDADIYFPTGATVHQCRRCKQPHDVAKRQAWVQEQAEDRLVHAALAARAVTVLGDYVTSAQVRGWAHRGRLMEKGRDEHQRPLYRLGDIIDLATEVIDQRSTRSRAAQ